MRENRAFCTIPALLAASWIAALAGAAQGEATADNGKGEKAMKSFAESDIHWLGHDGFMLAGEKTIYIDPYKIDGGATADIILITHDHFDHCSPEDIAKIQGPQTTVVAPRDCLGKIPGNKKAIKPGELLTLDTIVIEAVPAYNINKNFHPKANGWVGYVVTMKGFRIYHAGDTDHIPEMKTIKADIALLPVSGTYVMTAEEAVRAALDINPAIAIPMHYGAIVGQPDDAVRFRDLLKGKVDVVIKKKGA
ncbi:MAG TPA: MBL fold metallo-hydrolase [Candidatus Hydrogenedentes bacterium]|nr:MBL fold metallo-hydrolase [Candidatus Hydrogenedentota bacterium]HPC17104.1 MBL fold metallo-hydrolase [Candidatus Hydrogenedentota bacterium]HRT20513.1 MBL fold metallo-hydrolase [Candidatus Hydrogenedentota bacterium]HRT65282.1 MBL fold metallo-hydrolase [Candidatus Hydrogenedentota bacterium]